MSKQVREKASIIVHDSDWQFPAITEKYAYMQAQKCLWPVDGVCYLGFPWATLIDQLNTSTRESVKLMDELSRLTRNIKPGTRIVTVCQHIHMLKFKDIFIDNGVTDIFWTHAVKGETKIKSEREINLYPFPLFPVQFATRCPEADNTDRKHLFSFIGARANKWYLTESRNWILDILGGDPRGLVVGRDQWHYNKVVYDLQIRKTKKTKKGLIDKDASKQFREVLKQSTFSLCPSGSGPNSIRLWESLGAGSIPVILADTYALPGPIELWKEAVVFCKETAEDIRALPMILEEMSNDVALLNHKRKMLAQLWKLYGTEVFIYDIQKLFLDIANETPAIPKMARNSPISNNGLSVLSQTILKNQNVSEHDLEFFVNACISRLLTDRNSFRYQLNACRDTQSLLSEASRRIPDSATYRRFSSINNLDINDQNTLLKSYDLSHTQQPGINICLEGRHSNRTPMAYEAYQPHFAEIANFVPTQKQSDLIVTGFNIDISASKLDSEKHIAVISEEPLWDSVWSKGYSNVNRTVKTGDKTINYKFYNHVNSDIFEFDKIPYFLTTQNEYFLRYSNMFRRNSELSVNEILENWFQADFRCSFFAEKRMDESYDVSFPNDDLFGLSSFRTRVAQETSSGDILRIGKGWKKDQIKRQHLPDWHLDKLTTLDHRSLIVSGLENTHQKNYITEKIFDAYAALAIPLYFASPSHRIQTLVPEGSFINLFGKSVKESVKIINEFEPTPVFAQKYLEAQNQLAIIFGDTATLISERKRVVGEISTLIS